MSTPSTPRAPTPALSRHSVPLLLASLVYVAVYALTHAAGMTSVVYLPVERLWVSASPAEAIGMRYFGYLLQATVAGVAAFVIGSLPVVREAMSRRIGTLGRVVVVAAVLALAYFVLAELAQVV